MKHATVAAAASAPSSAPAPNDANSTPKTAALECNVFDASTGSSTRKLNPVVATTAVMDRTSQTSGVRRA